MSNPRWLVRGPADEQIEVVHDGPHVRAFQKGMGPQNHSLGSEAEAAQVIENWLQSLVDQGWTIIASGPSVMWHRIAEVEDGILTLTANKDLLEEDDFLAAITTHMMATEERVVRLSNKARIPDLSRLTYTLAAAEELPSVRAFIIDTASQRLDRQSKMYWGDIGIVIGAMPNIELVHIAGDHHVLELSSESLVSLQLETDPLVAENIEALCEAELPNLRRLALRLRNENEIAEDAMEALDALLVADPFPNLTHLQLLGIPEPAQLLERLAGMPMIQRLSSLRISDEDLEDEDVDLPLLKSVADSYAHLKELGINIDILSDEGVNELTAVIPGLIDDDELPRTSLPSHYERVARGELELVTTGPQPLPEIDDDDDE